jgi:hypothetical protein
MGALKDARAKTAAHHANHAAAEGHTVLVFLINVPRNTIGGVRSSV